MHKEIKDVPQTMTNTSYIVHFSLEDYFYPTFFKGGGVVRSKSMIFKILKAYEYIIFLDRVSDRAGVDPDPT